MTGYDDYRHGLEESAALYRNMNHSSPKPDLREAIAQWLWQFEFSRGKKAEWETLTKDAKNIWLETADHLLVRLRQHGLVRLDTDQSDQSLPSTSRYCSDVIKYGSDMWEAGWRKVKK